MRGVAIRSFELARALARVADVVLAAPAGGPAPVLPSSVELVSYDRERPRDLRRRISGADVVVAQPQPPVVMRWLNQSDARLIFDLYDPEVFENLAIFAGHHSRLDALWLSLTLDRLASAFHLGHHFLCASETQRDLWIGAMLAERVLRIDRYEADPSFRSVIAVVPFGLDGTAPRSAPGAGIRARFPAIGESDEIVLWNGGIWSWLDPVTPIAAVAELAGERPNVRLVFMGGGDDGPESLQAVAQKEASDRGLVNSTVFFNDQWVPYERRGSWLLEADCAVAAHGDHLETRFAFRTRLLDCFWAGLPIVTTTGDELARRVRLDDLGATAVPGDVAGFAAAIRQVLERGRADFAPQLALIADEFRWDRVCEPLVSFVLDPATTPRLGPLQRALAPRSSQRARAFAHQAARTAVALNPARRASR